MKYLTDVVRYDNFLTSQEVSDLHKYAIDAYNKQLAWPDYWFTKTFSDKLETSKHLRYWYNFGTVDVFEKSPLLKTVYERIKSTMQITSFKDYTIDPAIGFAINYVLPGGFIQAHSDVYQEEVSKKKRGIAPYYANKRHIRFNLMVNRGPEQCYCPSTVVDEDKMRGYNINVGDAWCFPADKIIHYVPKIVGNQIRIVYQFGFAIDV